MSTRREFLGQMAGAGVAVAASIASSSGLAAATSARGTEQSYASKSPIKLTKGPRIKAVIRREDSILRLGGVGDNYHMSWAADDRQLVAVCDGLGWPPYKAHYNSRLFTIAGARPQDAVFKEVAGYPDLVTTLKGETRMRYYGFGTLALDERIYQFLSTPNHQFTRDDSSAWTDARFIGTKLIYSPDNGRTWCNQDGSAPVVWEARQQRSRANMLFFEESQDAFSLLSVLQMGRNYGVNKDGYVYVYSPNGNTDGTMNQLVMFQGCDPMGALAG
jgi:hypothetical protein